MIYLWFIVGGIASFLLWFESFEYYEAWAERQPHYFLYNSSETEKNGEPTFTPISEFLLNTQNIIPNNTLTFKQRVIFRMWSMWEMIGMFIIFGFISLPAMFVADLLGIRV